MSRLTVGLTGGIASGKSTVQAMFAELGVPVLDADQVAREIVAPGEPALAEIVAVFGPQMLLEDGTLDRRRMRERVFADPAARQHLEAITHPHIRARMQRWRNAQTAPYCILSVAILIEAGMQPLVDRILVIDVPEAVQRQRLCDRDAIDAGLAAQMLAAQLGREQRLAHAHDILGNVGTREDLRTCVDRLHRFYLHLAATGTVQAAGLRCPPP
ncbi:dephospho-CoA kinase [Fontimonas thermophila]|uniref:Dephospho-CoA kinase n=1 Tax=Fontimonas thermophila TaxID=1076937 RepID=A0A1I2K714_9GAMM|nr:dephospho-CoA kinase [Fontimonas thermophila]SFF60871.1 dephospho-CoA kinase [Fontimonas thermophila]